MLDLRRSLYYYHLSKPKNDSDKELIKFISHWRNTHATAGAKKLAKLISGQGRLVNHKRIARILKENQLSAIKVKRKRQRINNIERLPIPKGIKQNNFIWSIDFMCARKQNAFKFMLLNVIDNGSRVAPLMKLERSFTALDVTDELERAMEEYGRPSGIITDNGAEFTSTHFKIWCKRNIIVHYLTNKGSPAENAFVESFNSWVRREVLDSNDFKSMNELREKIKKWHKYYNNERPHGSLSYQSPKNFIRYKETPELAV